MAPVPPALDPAELSAETGTLYPPAFAAAVAGRARRRLTAALGLTDFGVNLVELAPGAASALRHWHEQEDEFVYVLAGELTLVTEAGAQVLQAGQVAGFPKGVADGHHLLNHSSAPALYLEVGSRAAEERVDYPDVDLRFLRDGRDGRFTRKDGTPF